MRKLLYTLLFLFVACLLIQCKKESETKNGPATKPGPKINFPDAIYEAILDEDAKKVEEYMRNWKAAENAEVVNRIIKEDSVALIVAVSNNNTKDVLETLLNISEIDVNITIMRGRFEGATAVMYAARSNNVEIMRTLLADARLTAETINARVTSSGELEGLTALILTAQNPNAEVIKALLAHEDLSAETINASLVHPPRVGVTALILAVRQELTEVVKALLANEHILLDLCCTVNFSHYTALQIAQELQNGEITRLLEAAGATTTCSN